MWAAPWLAAFSSSPCLPLCASGSGWRPRAGAKTRSSSDGDRLLPTWHRILRPADRIRRRDASRSPDSPPLATSADHGVSALHLREPCIRVSHGNFRVRSNFSTEIYPPPYLAQIFQPRSRSTIAIKNAACDTRIRRKRKKKDVVQSRRNACL